MRSVHTGQQRAGSTRTLLTGVDGSVVKKTVLPGGLRVLTESVSGAHSVSVGFWVGVGSRDETAKSAGASHFLEHLLFKGTASRGPFEIASAIDDVGGDLNAFTTKEYTCYHARVLAQDAPIAADVLGDMIARSRIDPADVDAERGVVLEELAMYEDDYADVAHQQLARRMFMSSPLADPVIGTIPSLRAMSRSTVWKHYRRYYRPADVVITAAGAVDHAEFVRQIRKATKSWVADPSAVPTPARVLRAKPVKSKMITGASVVSRPTEQAHIAWGVRGLARSDERRWALAVLDTALGGGMSSRLFQEVREKRSLVYTVQSYRSSYSDAGVFGVYAGTMPDKAATTIEVIEDVLADVAKNGLTDAEVSRAKSQLRGSTALEADDTNARMSRLGESEVISGALLSIDDVLAKIDAVDGDQIASLAKTILKKPASVVVVGPYEQDHVFNVRS